MLSKIRYYVSGETLHMVYHGIFPSLMIYGSQIWGQHNAVAKRLQVLQNRALRIMHFRPPRTSATPLFKTSKILKINDFINLQNFLLVHDSLGGVLPASLGDKMKFLEHAHATRSLVCLQLVRNGTKTVIYGSKSIKARSVDIWNSVSKTRHNEKLHEKSRSVCK